MATLDVLKIWVIFERPRDYPDGFVVRPFLIGPGTVTPCPFARYAKDLAGARAYLPQGLYRMDRAPDDDPVVVESWL